MMKTLLIIALLAFSGAAFAGNAFLQHHYISGMNRICVYDYLGSQYHITIKSHQLCPLTIQV
jgi:hypothetical protein